jgi:hypothetical protein
MDGLATAAPLLKKRRKTRRYMGVKMVQFIRHLVARSTRLRVGVMS